MLSMLTLTFCLFKMEMLCSTVSWTTLRKLKDDFYFNIAIIYFGELSEVFHLTFHFHGSIL